MLNIKINFKGMDGLEAELRKQFKQISDQELNNSLPKLADKSPVFKGDLKRNWVQETKEDKKKIIKAKIYNKIPNSLARVVGNAPGGNLTISKISDWARAKGIVNVAALTKKINEEGTIRWREKENPLGLNRQGEPNQGSIFFSIRNRLIRRLNSIKIK